MRLEFDFDGSWLVDPQELAPRLGMAGNELKRRMRLGHVVSRIETGSGADTGRSRVTVTVGGTAWQGIFDQGGSLLDECSS